MDNHLFFDLDHTLWDFETNARDTLIELYIEHQIQLLTPKTANDFILIYNEINHQLWELYRKNEISKAQLRVKRFEDTFKAMGIDKRFIPPDIGEQYIEICPTKTALLPGAIQTLDYLNENFQLHIITNGFEESQYKKLRCANLSHYFKSVTISEHVGYQKPHPIVFRTALKNAGCRTHSGHYIGDNLEADIKGAINSGWKAYWLCKEDDHYNHEDCTMIRDLRELTTIF